MFRRGWSCSCGTRDRVNRHGEIRRNGPASRLAAGAIPHLTLWHAHLARFANRR